MKKEMKLPRVGQRIVKSSIAVALCFVIYFLRGKRGIPFYSALAVLQCIQPYTVSSIEVAKKRVTGTFVGAFWGLVLILIEVYLFGDFQGTFPGYMMIALFTGVVLYSTVLMNCKNAAYFSCVVFLSITVIHLGDESPVLFVCNRVLDTLIGVGLAFVVNCVHFPRKKEREILFVSGIDDTIAPGTAPLSPYSKIELNRMIDSGAKFTVSTNRTPATVRESLEGVRLNLPIIAMDGAVLYDMKENSYLMKYQMSPSQAGLILDFLKTEQMECFINTVVDDMLVIYYNQLSNEAEKGIYQRHRTSPYRNYVQKNESICENVVYLLVIDQKDRMQEFYEKLMKQKEAKEYRIVYEDSFHYPGYAYMKLYHREATREHMLENLKAFLKTERTVTFGSIEGKYDVYIKNADKDVMVRKLRNLYEPIGIR